MSNSEKPLKGGQRQVICHIRCRCRLSIRIDRELLRSVVDEPFLANRTSPMKEKQNKTKQKEQQQRLRNSQQEIHKPTLDGRHFLNFFFLVRDSPFASFVFFVFFLFAPPPTARLVNGPVNETGGFLCFGLDFGVFPPCRPRR